MKKIITTILILTILIPAVVSAYTPVYVYLDGKLLEFDADPRILNGRTLVPLRKIFEELGAEVDWNEKTHTVIAEKGDIAFSLTIGSSSYFVNENVYKLDVPARIIDNRTFVPLRIVSEAFGAMVEWDKYLRRVIITTESVRNTMYYEDSNVISFEYVTGEVLNKKDVVSKDVVNYKYKPEDSKAFEVYVDMLRTEGFVIEDTYEASDCFEYMMVRSKPFASCNVTLYTNGEVWVSPVLEESYHEEDEMDGENCYPGTVVPCFHLVFSAEFKHSTIENGALVYVYPFDVNRNEFMKYIAYMQMLGWECVESEEFKNAENGNIEKVIEYYIHHESGSVLKITGDGKKNEIIIAPIEL